MKRIVPVGMIRLKRRLGWLEMGRKKIAYQFILFMAIW